MELGTTLNNGANWFVDGISLRLGSGEKIKSWHDKWVGPEPLMHVYPRLYSVTANKYATVSEMGQWSGELWLWQWNLRRQLFDWEELLSREL